MAAKNAYFTNINSTYDLGKVYAMAFPDDEYIQMFGDDYEALGEDMITGRVVVGYFGDPKGKGLPGYYKGFEWDPREFNQSEWDRILSVSASYKG